MKAFSDSRKEMLYSLIWAFYNLMNLMLYTEKSVICRMHQLDNRKEQ